ncbi:MAG: phosphopentomutase [Deltaproteobacteria bacterium]|nr:phosphopentomutase [Deltaproteobacteria bacterium]
MIKKAIVIVFDGLGIGELPDAGDYCDAGSDTIDNVSRAAGGVRIPNLASFGMGLIEGVTEVSKARPALGSYGRMREASPGKDTATGHWEMAGIILDKPFPTYPQGLPIEMLEGFERAAGRGWIGGMAASGTEIIERLGPEHLKTGRVIVYTSADSVFQIAAHEDVVPVPELYRVCAAAREFLDAYNIGRVIARPFTGRPGAFKRTERRRDWSVPPPGVTVIERIKTAGHPVAGIGKIGDIFCHRGLTEEIHTRSDADGIGKTVEAMRRHKHGLIFTNLVDFDTLYGHRNDAIGYAAALERIDARLPEITAIMDEDAALFITGDHGCDPTTPSTGHSREYVPIIAYGKALRKGVNLGTRETFSDLGATLAQIFKVEPCARGRSFLPEIMT